MYTVLYILTFKEFKNGEKKKMERESKTTGQCSMTDWWGQGTVKFNLYIGSINRHFFISMS